MFSIGKANAALAAAIVFLLLSSCSAYFAFSRLHHSEQWVHHTRDVQSALAQFAMTTARAGRLRAEYVDTGDPSVLEEQTGVVRQLRGTIVSLQNLTADNHTEQDNCRRLAELSEKRIILMDQAIALKKAGNSTLLAQSLITRQIVAIAEESDLLLQRMYDSEEQLLAERQESVRRSTRAIAVILGTSLVLAVILFVVHHRLLTDLAAARARAESAQRALSGRLLTLQDEERRKFARELHDSVGQHLAALKMAISMLLAKLPNDQTLQDCIKLLDDSISETRTISHLLHPPLLDEAGLNSASRWFVEGFGHRSGIEINLDIQDGNVRWSEAIELVLFRVLQESLTNVHRHSGAMRADVSLRTAGDSVILRVRDYGRGMPASVLQSVTNDGAGNGVGLAGMKERIREVGGRLEIHSSGTGTEIVARVPLRRRVEPVDFRAVEQQVKQS
jgi:signal transduction histidine kinase